ncbi:MAG: group 1 truncated hemoglobin [Usitatibacter sp.]
MRSVLPLLTSLLLAACATNPAAPPTLYARIGGEPVVRKVVDELVDRTAKDPRTSRSFKDVKLARVKEKLEEQICMLSGGPCKYTGDPMKEVHKGLRNTEAEFYLLVQFLRDALANAGVREAEKNELLRLLAPMKRDVVTG